jgi:hypothetical protein
MFFKRGWEKGAHYGHTYRKLAEDFTRFAFSSFSLFDNFSNILITVI